jgi:hypothetical protein
MSEEFRITFFFGPDDVPGRADVLVCVFNVKKRSWKGGVQVGIELSKSQLDQAGDRGQLGELLEMIRAKVEPDVFVDYEQRASDLFTQQVCRLKLDLAIAAGISQENQTIAVDAFSSELDAALAPNAGAIRTAILTELDV